MKRKLGLLLLGFIALDVFRVEACGTSERSDAEARLDYLATRIAAGELPGVAPGHPFDGEWTLSTLSMASVAAANLGFRYPETQLQRAKQVSAWAAQLASEEVRAYDTRQWGGDAMDTLERPDGHAGYLGHVVLALDAACLLGGTRDVALHERLVAALARRIDTSPTGLIETYPGETYVPDNVVVLASLMQFDACVGEARHAELKSRWLGKLHARWLDADNGVLVFAPGQRARGSGAAWNSFYLPFVDERFAAEQSERTWVTFGDTALGGWLARHSRVAGGRAAGRGRRFRPAGDGRVALGHGLRARRRDAAGEERATAGDSPHGGVGGGELEWPLPRLPAGGRRHRARGEDHDPLAHPSRR